MRSFPLALVLGLMLLAPAPPAQAAGKWTRVHSAHFVFVGDASERDLRRTAERLEQFREVLTRALPRAAAESPVPTVVMVFKNDESLTPYKPLFQGKPIAIAGYFQPGDDINYIIVNADLGDAAFSTVFHEYSHFLAGNTMGVLPVWLNEGLAQVYETFETRSGGKSALIGIATADDIRLLRANTLMPLRELLAVDWLSPVYNEGDRRSVFYAESWALAHYVMLGNPARAPQFNQYLSLLTRGVASEAAFAQAFGPDQAALEKELRAYVGKFSFPAVRFDFDAKISLGASGPGEAIDDAEAGAYLGDLLARTRRPGEARSQLTSLRAANPQSGRTALSLGLLELREGHLDLAQPLLEQAASLLPSDDGAQLAFGEVLLERLRTLAPSSDVANETIARARRALERSLELSPNLAHALATLGQLEVLVGEDLPRAASYLDRAAKLVPSRESYRLLLAAALIRQSEYERARQTLGPLLAMGSRQEIRESARRLLRAMSDRMQFDRELAERRAMAASAASSPSVSPPVASPPPNREASLWQLETPPLKANQARVVGLFTGVECERGAVVFTVQAAGKPFKLRAASFAAVDFVTYRNDTPRSVNCGAIASPLLVQATYQVPGGAGVDGQAIMIEILPEGYPVR